MFSMFKKKEAIVEFPDRIELKDMVKFDKEEVVEVKNDVEKELLKEASEIIAEYLKGYSNIPRASKWINEYNKEK